MEEWQWRTHRCNATRDQWRCMKERGHEDDHAHGSTDFAWPNPATIHIREDKLSEAIDAAREEGRREGRAGVAQLEAALEYSHQNVAAISECVKDSQSAVWRILKVIRARAGLTKVVP